MHYMTQERPPPARPLYSLVIRKLALLGWTKVELAERSGVARTTIDNWNTNRRRPSAQAVNAVADTLGIDREEAHVLAGIVLPDAETGARILRQMVQDMGLPDDQLAAVLEEIEATRRGDPPPGRANGRHEKAS